MGIDEHDGGAAQDTDGRPDPDRADPDRTVTRNTSPSATEEWETTSAQELGTTRPLPEAPTQYIGDPTPTRPLSEIRSPSETRPLSETTPRTVPDATTPRATPDSTTLRVTPDSRGPQPDPEATDPRTAPEATRPLTVPEATGSQVTPEPPEPHPTTGAEAPDLTTPVTAPATAAVQEPPVPTPETPVPTPRPGTGPTSPQDPAPPQNQDGYEEPEAPPGNLWERMRQDPEYAPEYLALAAVDRIGPQAERWVADMRLAYPRLTDDDLAEKVRTRFVKLSRYSGAVAGVAGIVGAVADTGVLAWTQARMVIHLAAVYGEDPRDRERATDLLMLQGVYDVTERARAALDVAAGRAPVQHLFGGTGLIAMTAKLSRMVGMRMVRRAVGKVVPGAAVVFGAMANAGSSKQLADRAVTHYRELARRHG